MWEVVEAKAGKSRMTETEERRKEGRSRKEARREGIEEEKEKTKDREKNGSMKDSRRIGNLGRRRRSKVRRRSKKTGTRETS